jgi:hypothetical protein
VREREPSFMNPRPVDDPFRIEAVCLEQVLIGDNQLGHVAARTENPDAQERAGVRREMGLAVAHERYATDFIRDVSVTSLVSPLARNVHLLRRNWQSPSFVKQS